jgi:glucose dehydrogenase
VYDVLDGDGCRIRSPISKKAEWPFYGGDQGGAKYSKLADVNAKNVSLLHEARSWKTGETELPQYGSRPGMFEVTPLMIDNVLYLTTPYNKVVALKAGTGRSFGPTTPKPMSLASQRTVQVGCTAGLPHGVMVGSCASSSIAATV